MRAVSPLWANSAALAALFSFVALMILELAPKSLRDEKRIMGFILLLVVLVLWIQVLELWNPSLWFITLKIFRDTIVPLERRRNFGMVCTALDSCFGLPGGPRAL